MTLKSQTTQQPTPAARQHHIRHETVSNRYTGRFSQIDKFTTWPYAAAEAVAPINIHRAGQ